jgi:Subtilase family
VSYDRALEWNEPPAPAERRYARWSVVRAAAAPAACWWPLARLGAVELYLSPPGHERDAPVLYTEPLLAAKRGRRGTGEYPGVDGLVALPRFHDAEGGDASEPPPLWPSAGGPAGPGDGRTRVAVIDVCFDNAAVLEGLRDASAGSVDGPHPVGVATEPARLALTAAPGHGTAMAGIVLAEVPGVHVGLFRLPGVGGAAPPYLAATSLAAAIAAAVGDFAADVVLVAMSDGAWGTPRHLRDVLREAARAGRGGRGAAIFCSVGDPSRNHARAEDSAALGADDLASQPWVMAVAACDDEGRWYRAVHADETRPPATYNRFGPAVALSARGTPRRYGGCVAADDSSQACALAAAAAALVLRASPDLTVGELRTTLALTARVSAVVDGGRGLAAGSFDARDRLGHSLKVGHGAVDARAARLAAGDPICMALLATREVPDPAPAETGIALDMAEAWDAAVRRAARRRDPVAAGYLRLRARLVPCFLHSLEAQEALAFLARHLRAICETGGASWWGSSQDHGALRVRIRHAVDVLRDSAADPAVKDWLELLDGAIDPQDSLGLGFLRSPLELFLATAFAPVRRGRSGGSGWVPCVSSGWNDRQRVGT